MVINSSRTLYGMLLQSAFLTHIPYRVLPNTVLNSKFAILQDYELEDYVYPRINYFTIGVGGVNLESNVNGYSISTHTPIDAGLFEEVPFVIKPIDNDLEPDDRSKYRFRKKELINGKEYYCYYLKKIDSSDIRNGLFSVTVTDDIPKLRRFSTNNRDLLYPKPKDRADGILDYKNVEYVANSNKIKFHLYKEELKDLNEALSIKYPDEDKKLTELGVCTGIDIEEYDSYDDTITEAAVVQIAYHYTIEVLPKILMENNKELIRAIEIGGMEPLYKYKEE